jgi:hypothetical protein
VLLVFASCERKQSPSEISPKLALDLNRIQAESSLSDEDMSKALERWIEVYSGTQDLLESEEALGDKAWTPERLGKLHEGIEKVISETRSEDRLLALISLNHLSSLNNKRYDEIAITLREIIAKHYREVMGRTNEVDMIYVRKARELANTDPELKKLLEMEPRKENAKDPQPKSDGTSR